MAIEVRRQRKRIELTKRAHIAKLGFARPNRLIRRSLHGRQLQAEIAQLHALCFRHSGPARHGNTVPGPQTALEPRGLDGIQAHLLIVPGFDFTGRQGDNPGVSGLAVQAEGRQFGIVGMGRNHHHPLLAIVRLLE
ncbi:hypothetical protein D3C78_658500 [compost metagenome]